MARRNRSLLVRCKGSGGHLVREQAAGQRPAPDSEARGIDRTRDQKQGTTLIACEKHGRQARLVELEPKYVDTVIRRWEQYTERKATLAEPG
jgi:hypothetical protein